MAKSFRCSGRSELRTSSPSSRQMRLWPMASSGIGFNPKAAWNCNSPNSSLYSIFPVLAGRVPIVIAATVCRMAWANFDLSALARLPGTAAMRSRTLSSSGRVPVPDHAVQGVRRALTPRLAIVSAASIWPRNLLLWPMPGFLCHVQSSSASRPAALHCVTNAFCPFVWPAEWIGESAVCIGTPCNVACARFEYPFIPVCTPFVFKMRHCECLRMLLIAKLQTTDIIGDT